MLIKHFCLLIALFISTFASNCYAKVIHQERSVYRNILVDEKDGIRCLKFNVKSAQSRQSCLYSNDKDRLVFDYTKLLFSSLLFTQEINNVLIIGLGGGTVSNVLHQLYPQANIHNIEIDPAVIKVAKQYFDFKENKQVSSQVIDGRIFVKRALFKDTRYDLIILDAFNGDYIPEHLMTKEFQVELKQLLTPKGILASNTFSTSKLYKYESATYFDVWHEFHQVRPKENSNRIILVSPAKLPSQKEIANKAEALHPLLTRYDINILEIARIMQLIKTPQGWDENTPILTDQYSPANLLNDE